MVAAETVDGGHADAVVCDATTTFFMPLMMDDNDIRNHDGQYLWPV